MYSIHVVVRVCVKCLGKYSCSDLIWDISFSWVAIYRTTVMTQSANASKHVDTHRHSLALGQVGAFDWVHRHAAWPPNNITVLLSGLRGNKAEEHNERLFVFHTLCELYVREEMKEPKRSTIKDKSFYWLIQHFGKHLFALWLLDDKTLSLTHICTINIEAAAI